MSNVKLLDANIKCLKLFALWPRENETACEKYSKRTIFFISITPCAMGAVIEMVRELNGFRDSTKTLIELFIAMICFSVLYSFGLIFHSRRSKLLYLVRDLKNLENIFIPYNIAQTESKIHRYVYGSLFLQVLGIIMHISFPMIDTRACEAEWKFRVHTRHLRCGLLSPIWMPFDLNIWYYFAVYVVNMVYILIAFTIIIAETILFHVSCMLHVIGHIDQLKIEVTKAVNFKDHQHFKKCVDYHCAIITFVQFFDKCFSPLSFCLLFFCSALLGMIGILILTAENFFDGFRHTAHFLMWVVMLYVITYFSQKLTEESLNVGDDLYATKWMDCSIKFRKDIVMMLLRTRKPILLSSGPVGTFQIATFLKILRTAYSCFALLLNLRHKS